ncbi:hypothetical protein GWK47_037854 [Chionoecetes opilio]|uniref:Uncharacterized protein n=1 Tax=Chionoecetes opilio TaxID=41210 RepID=A0A8J4YEI9_CHIOP|nr:hypothetical protein GWK47_037854 [Chionoecetes opilio]
MRITSIIRVVVAMVVVGGFLLYLYVDHEHYLVGLSSTSYSEIAMRLFQDTREEKAPWWKEVLCRRGGHQTELPGHKAVPLKMLFSWARQNPDRQVWFLLTSGQLEGGHALTSLLLQQYTNIHLVTADVMDLFKDTPLLSLLNSRMWTDSWPIELMSDMLRVLVLWWWGACTATPMSSVYGPSPCLPTHWVSSMPFKSAAPSTVFAPVIPHF